MVSFCYVVPVHVWCYLGAAIGYPYYGHLIPVKTRYQLTSIMWPYRGLKFRGHRSHVFFFKFTAARVFGNQEQCL